MAVSTTSDATGSYNRYAFSFNNLPDYPKFGVWPDGYYASYNMYQNGTTFVGAWVCAYNRSAMLVGSSAAQICFQQNVAPDFSYLPSDLDGSTLPPSGRANFFMDIRSTLHGGPFINIQKFHVDFANPANSTLTAGNPLTITYNPPCGTCVPQEGTSQTLDTLGGRLMHRLAYRNFGDHEAWVVCQTVAAPPGGWQAFDGTRFATLVVRKPCTSKAPSRRI